jgi:hypothetical protein
MGGLFATYTMLTRPDAFSRYVIGSPWLYWNTPVTETYEPSYAARHSDLDARVFIGAGGSEAVPTPGMDQSLWSMMRIADVPRRAMKLADDLCSRGYPSLRLDARIFDCETHFSVAPMVISAGLRSVFSS